jgi:hypothetical protein
MTHQKRVKPRTNVVYAGFRSGKLTVVQRVADKKTSTANLRVQVRVLCDCGNRLTIPFWYLVRPHSPPKTSCGSCNPKSLQVQFPELHSVWYMMNYRCEIPTFKQWDAYGGRGIKVCKRWSWNREDGNGFANFVADKHPRPPNLSLDRINNNGHYTPANTRWATAEQQRANQGRGEVLPLADTESGDPE